MLGEAWMYINKTSLKRKAMFCLCTKHCPFLFLNCSFDTTYITYSDIHSHLCHSEWGLCCVNQIQSACRNNINILCSTPLCWRLYYSSPNQQQHSNTPVSAGGLDTATLRSIMPYLCLRVLCYILGACSRVKINAVNTALWMNKFPPCRHYSMVHR